MTSRTGAAVPAARTAPAVEPDPLDHPVPRVAADAATVECLLRCWVRETGPPRPAGGALLVPLAATGGALLVPVRYWSATGWHRFGPPALESAPPDAPPVDAVTLAGLLAREAGYGRRAAEAPGGPAPRAGSPGAGRPGAEGAGGRGSATGRVPAGAQDGACPGPSAGAAAPARAAPADGPEAGAVAASSGPSAAPPAPGGTDPLRPAAAAGPSETAAVRACPAGSPGHPPVAVPAGDLPEADAAAFAGRVADSVRRTAAFLGYRRAEPADPGTGGPFLAAEQSVVLGHPMHPAPAGREGLTDAECRRYSPQARGSFPLHWFAVDRSVLAADSAWTERGRVVPADQIAASLAASGVRLPGGAVPLPLHPWQAREVRQRTGVAELFAAGLLRDLGPCGEPWHPTSSARTVYRPGAPAMLKLSLAPPVTGSRREHLRTELHRGVEVHRLLRGGLGARLRAAFPGRPGFDIVRDPAWLAVDGPDGGPVAGLDVVIRHCPFGPADDAACVAGLTAPRPWPGRTRLSSRLAQLVIRLAARTGRPVRVVAAEWFLRYLHVVVRPLLWLDGEAGIALEAHQRNTLVLLDADGWPAGGRYRGNQGCAYRESRRPELQRRLPGVGSRSGSFVADHVADERFLYDLGVDNVLGLVGAFGSQRLCDERVLLAALRRFLAAAASGPARLSSSLPARFLDSPTLRCGADLLTRLYGPDEPVGPVETPSVHVTIANPLHPATA
ncbi:IucA/IucC family protein [Streptomyces sp. B1866]|uniref:IucA/IucC family protein n=1 Tax=Streptomyces sp. B1866 TaxID=3075431 RepID=UPI00288E742C|nr:IucA/IucC family protein [Streptomyces sp. B1866]MDT3400578.1 IucA/IucC family protein [Streptomyces sp. B1866]